MLEKGRGTAKSRKATGSRDGLTGQRAWKSSLENCQGNAVESKKDKIGQRNTAGSKKDKISQSNTAERKKDKISQRNTAGSKKDKISQSNTAERKKDKRSQGKNYQKYHMALKDPAVCTGTAVLLSAAIAWLFYRSLYGMAVFPVVWFAFFWKQKQAGIQRQQRVLREQFKECIRVVTASLYAGYSVENAFLEAEKELVQLLGSQADMCRELQEINRQIKLNIPTEELIQNLADRSGIEEIQSFGQVFAYAKRNGSDFPRILRDTSDRITEKIELEKELQTMIAAKRMEQKIMNVIPMGILFFVDMTSPDFLQMMYTGVFGRVMMSIFLVVYVGAYLLSEKIVDIRI